MSEAGPVFYYDLASPYAYLAAHRVDAMLAVPVRWVPVVFGAILAAAGRRPWSLDPVRREPGQRDVAARAAERGLPVVRWPDGWPDQSYSVVGLRAVLVAGERGDDASKRLALKLFEVQFAAGLALDDVGRILDAAGACGLDADAIGAGVRRADVKAALRANTDEAIARGVTGVPTVAVGDRLFWGDDRLQEAAAALG